MAKHYIFPSGYGQPDQANENVPMVGFQPLKIGDGSSIGDLRTDGINEWVWLPMPTEGIATSYQQNWADSEPGAMKAGISKLVSMGTNKLAGEEGGEGGGASGLNIFGSVKDTFGKGGLLETGLQQAVGVSGITSRLLQQTYMAYSGPTYRTHAFSFTLMPQSADESETIEKIVNFFKYYSQPILQNNSVLARQYKVPHIFQIAFAPKKGLPGINPSALSQVDAKFGGEKYNIFASTKHPTSVTLTLSFKEMELLARDIKDKPMYGGEASQAST